MRGIITEVNADLYTIYVDNRKFTAKARGVFRKRHIEPKVGDICLLSNEGIITDILPRKNTLDRPFVSNIDILFIVTSLKSPDFSTNLLDKFLIIAYLNNIKPIICYSKEDLLDKDEHKEIFNILSYYKKIGYTVVSNRDIKEIKKIIKGNTCCFTGQTGAGKSTLLNSLDKNLKLKTDEISKALGRGKHTTRLTTLYSVAGGYMLDTPGFSDIDISKFSDEDIRNSFIEFKKYPCKYRDCNHTKEDECSVKKAVRDGHILKSRYDNYLLFIERRKR